jgi:hypothetical protein
MAIFRSSEGVLQRRALRTQRIMAIVFILCIVVIVYYAIGRPVLVGPAVIGLIGGASAIFWIMAHSTRFRAPVMMRICDWEKAKALLANRPEA